MNSLDGLKGPHVLDGCSNWRWLRGCQTPLSTGYFHQPTPVVQKQHVVILQHPSTFLGGLTASLIPSQVVFQKSFTVAGMTTTQTLAYRLHSKTLILSDSLVPIWVRQMIHAMKTSFLRLCVFACLAITYLEDGGFCAETVSVKLASGRWFTGEVDARTDNEQLWLRFGDSTTSLLRPIRWSCVDFGSIAETALTLPEFKEHAMNLATSHNVFEPPVSEAAPSTASPAEITRDGIPDAKTTAVTNLTKRNLLASIDFETYVANWDNDVENDGLILWLQPRDDQGEISKMVHGTLHIELITTLHAEPHNSFRRQGRQIVTLGTWVKHLVQDHVDTKGILVKLPFQANHPEFSSRMGTHGLVHVKFVVPGQGAFEASQDSIRVRPFSPLRDLREQQHDRRFFANEGTGRAKR